MSTIESRWIGKVRKSLKIALTIIFNNSNFLLRISLLGIMCLLVIAWQTYTNGRNWLDHTENPIATHKRRSGKRIRQTEIRYTTRESTSESISYELIYFFSIPLLRVFGAALLRGKTVVFNQCKIIYQLDRP